MTLQTLEQEHNIIGCAMHSPADCDEAFERLKPEHFSSPYHARLWDVILTKVKAQGSPDPVTLIGMVGQDPGFEEHGGVGYLAELVDRAMLWPLPDHIATVLDRSARRDLISLTKHVQAITPDISLTAENVLAELERGAAEIARDGTSKPLAVPAGLTALETIEAAWRGEFVGTSVGLETLDRVTGGIRQDDVWFIGGRTSMGKSVVGLTLAKGIAEQKRGVMVFSLEMPLREVQARLISDIAFEQARTYEGGNVRYGDLLKGRGSPEVRDRARHAAKALASLPIAVADQGGLTIDDIRIQAQRQFRQWDKAGVHRGAILIDHIGLVKPSKARNDSKAAETADIVNELKALAKQLRAPVIALCQVNRQTEGRNDKRPTLSDLNWSGAIEQIADFICLLYRDAYYLERTAGPDAERAAIEKANDLELLIHKNRSGPICNLHAFVDVACNAVRDLADERTMAHAR